MRRRPAVSARAFVETKAGLEHDGRRASLLIPATSEDAQGHCQTKFYTACLSAGTRWSSTVFAHELPPRSASFEAENGLYLFALTMPAQGVRRGGDGAQPWA